MKALEILIVEDDPALGPLLGELLQEMGIRVCAIARTMREAVDAALALKPDCMIVDARLGSGSGLDAIEEITRERDIPYIIMSGGPVLGATGGPVLTKPFNQGQLEAALRQAMTGRRAPG